MLELTGPRVHAFNAYYCRQLGLDEGVLRQCTALLVKALEGGQHRTRKELETTLAHSGLAATGMRMADILMHAELNGVICSGPPKVKQQTYALLAERATDVLDVAGAARWTAQDRPTFNLVVLLDSQVAGFWRRTITRDSVLIHAALTRAFDAAELVALDAAARRHADFLGVRNAVVTTEWPTAP
jgi:hypothetical protein